MEAAPSAAYVVFCEDDIVFAPGILQQLDTLLDKVQSANASADIITLMTSSAGHQQPVQLTDPWSVFFGTRGLVMQSAVAQEFMIYCRNRFADAPVDWLLNFFIQERRKSLWAIYPNVVDHVGSTSSLPGKHQSLVSSTFEGRGCRVDSQSE